MAAASIFCNSAGVDTSKSRVIPLDALLHFLDHFQRENCGEDGAKQLIMVRDRHVLCNMSDTGCPIWLYTYDGLTLI